MAGWENIVSDKELIKVKNDRKNEYIYRKEYKSALADLESDGWEYVKEYADKKRIQVRKEKKFDEKFENKIWMLMYNMGFTDLNKDRTFTLVYDKDGHTQQIDVFAADDETVLIIECKSAENQKNSSFKKEMEALRGQKEGLIKEIRKRYPNSKIKFIWATENIIMQKADLERLKTWGIEHFGKNEISYYYELTRHLGSSARYQLLGNLFANSEIKNLQNKIPAIQGKMGGHKYYEFSIEPEKLLKIGYVLHRSKANRYMMPTYQRVIKKNRLKSVRAFIDNGGYFPNSLIISIDTNGKQLQFDKVQTKGDDFLSKVGILHLPKKYHSAYIIDGQHRLYGFSDSQYSKNNTIPVVAFENLNRKEQLKLFMEINENQKAVSKTLRVTLNKDLLWESEKKSEQREALRSRIAQMCGEEATSPLLDRVVIGEDYKTPMKCITVEAIQNALKRTDFFSVFTKGNDIEKPGTFDTGELESTCTKLYKFLEESLSYVRESCLEEWELGENGILTINRGIQAVIRIINDIVNQCIEQNKINILKDELSKKMAEIYFYLKPLTDYINSIDEAGRKELKSFLGGGGDNQFWRRFQKIIAENIEDFNPPGLKEFIENETQQYNEDARNYLLALDKQVKSIVKEKLEQKYGNNWLEQGLPKHIYKNADGCAADKKYEAAQSNIDIEVETWDFVTLKDIKEIVVYRDHWSIIFEKLFTLPAESKRGGNKEQKTEWLSLLDKEAAQLSKSNYSISRDKFEKISDIYGFIVEDIQL
jgi:DGQHR domain